MIARTTLETPSPVPEPDRLAEALRRSRQTLSETQRLAHLGSYECDPETGQAWWSEELRRILALPGSELQGTLQDILDRVHPLDRERVAAEIERIHRTGEGEFEHRVLLPGGRPRTVWVRMETARNEQGRLRQFGAVLDITERRLAEQALEASEARFRRLAENAPDAIYRYRLTAPAGFEYVSPAATAISGYSPEEYYADARLAARKVHPEDRKLLRSRLSARSGTPTTLRWVRKDGRVIWVELRDVPVKDETGRVVAIEGLARDVTERIVADRLLQETTDILEALVQASPLAITVVDRAAHVLMWNPAAEKLFGWTASQVLGRLVPVLSPEDRDAFLGPDVLRAKGNPETGHEVRSVRADGSPLDATLWTAPLRDADGQGIATIALFADDTARRTAADELHRRRELLRRLASRLSLTEEKERRRIATELHDGIAQTLAFAKMHLRGLQSAGGAGLEQLADLLDQAIRETRSLTAEISCSALYRFGLVPALHWLCEQFEHRHGVSCRFEEDGQPGELSENLRVLVYQTVRELLANAVKHAGGSHIRVSLDTLGGDLRVAVLDDGAGFPEGGAARDPGLTSGFGLFSIQERWGEYGGRLSVESEPGRGSRVQVSAPLSGP